MKRAAVLVDLSGTLHIGDSAIVNAPEALQRLRMLRPVRFLTNTTKESISVLHSRLVKCGFSIAADEIFTSLIAARRYIEENSLRPLLMVDSRAIEDFRGINVDSPNAVVMGLAPEEFHYDRMNEAFRAVLQGAELIAIHKGRYYRREDGLALGPGPFVSALEFSTGKTATVVGKPERKFFELCINAMNEDIDINNSVMIGDDVNDDILGAINIGMKGILVKTGKYRKGDETQIPEERRNCVNSFVEAVDLIQQGNIL